MDSLSLLPIDDPETKRNRLPPARMGIDYGFKRKGRGEEKIVYPIKTNESTAHDSGDQFLSQEDDSKLPLKPPDKPQRKRSAVGDESRPDQTLNPKDGASHSAQIDEDRKRRAAPGSDNQPAKKSKLKKVSTRELKDLELRRKSESKPSKRSKKRMSRKLAHGFGPVFARHPESLRPVKLVCPLCHSAAFRNQEYFFFEIHMNEHGIDFQNIWEAALHCGTEIAEEQMDPESKFQNISYCERQLKLHGGEIRKASTLEPFYYTEDPPALAVPIYSRNPKTSAVVRLVCPGCQRDRWPTNKFASARDHFLQQHKFDLLNRWEAGFFIGVEVAPTELARLSGKVTDLKTCRRKWKKKEVRYDLSLDDLSVVQPLASVKISGSSDEGQLAKRPKKKALNAAKKKRNENDEAPPPPPKKAKSTIEHDDWCLECLEGGELLLCETCSRAFHKDCTDLTAVPKGAFFCTYCQKDTRDPEESDDFCSVCDKGGDLILCDRCPRVWHLGCLDPPLERVPEEDWLCPICRACVVCHREAGNPRECSCGATFHPECKLPWMKPDRCPDCSIDPQLGNLQKIMASRKNGDLTEFHVKWQDKAYIHCEWISEHRANKINALKVKNFLKREPDDDAPENGIYAEWTQPERIIGAQEGDKYIVKWRQLDYSEATPESRTDIENFQGLYDDYLLRANWKNFLAEGKLIASATKNAQFIKLEQQPSSLKGGELHPYQLEGVNFLLYGYINNNNSILADEMGLGKTIQAISFIAALRERHLTRGPFLVVGPLSTLYQWQREFQTWAPRINVVLYNGSESARKRCRSFEFYFQEDSTKQHAKFQVLLMSYEMVLADSKHLKKISWNTLIVDEGHRLKNSEAKLYRALNQYQIAHRILLTGTPLQNNLEELFNLLEFIAPNQHQHIRAEELHSEGIMTRLHNILKLHILRRTKAQVLHDLPSKKETLVPVDLTGLQKKYYRLILAKNLPEIKQSLKGQVSLMNVLMELRKCVNHPYLFEVRPAYLSSTQDAEDPNEDPNLLIQASGKMLVLDKMLDQLIGAGHKVLIFSQFKMMLDVLEKYLGTNTLFTDGTESKNLGFERIDGEMRADERQRAMDRFNLEDQSMVFLLSTRSGGLGLNLARADTVIIYDADWNPHADIQALSRAHRIGQKNSVMVFRLVTRNTIEEKIHQVAAEKLDLEDTIIKALNNSKARDVAGIMSHGLSEILRDDTEGNIVYDDEKIAALLSRSTAEDPLREKGKEGGIWKDFSVPSFNHTIRTDGKAADPFNEAYWDELLAAQHESLRQAEEAKTGRGKRVRRKSSEEAYSSEAEPGSDSDSDVIFDEAADPSVPEDIRRRAAIREILWAYGFGRFSPNWPVTPGAHFLDHKLPSVLAGLSAMEVGQLACSFLERTTDQKLIDRCMLIGLIARKLRHYRDTRDFEVRRRDGFPLPDGQSWSSALDVCMLLGVLRHGPDKSHAILNDRALQLKGMVEQTESVYSTAQSASGFMRDRLRLLTRAIEAEGREEFGAFTFATVLALQQPNATPFVTAPKSVYPVPPKTEAELRLDLEKAISVREAAQHRGDLITQADAQVQIKELQKLLSEKAPPPPTVAAKKAPRPSMPPVLEPHPPVAEAAKEQNPPTAEAAKEKNPPFAEAGKEKKTPPDAKAATAQFNALMQKALIFAQEFDNLHQDPEVCNRSLASLDQMRASLLASLNPL